MEYSIEVLEKEIKHLTECLSEWDLKHYPEARKVRQLKLDDLQKAKTCLNLVNNGIDPFTNGAFK